MQLRIIYMIALLAVSRSVIAAADDDGWEVIEYEDTCGANQTGEASGTAPDNAPSQGVCNTFRVIGGAFNLNVGNLVLGGCTFQFYNTGGSCSTPSDFTVGQAGTSVCYKPDGGANRVNVACSKSKGGRRSIEYIA